MGFSVATAGAGRHGTACVLDHIERPDLRVLVMSSTGDTITVEVANGVLSDLDSLLYVERRGFFEVMRTERRFTSGGARESLALRAFPSAST